MRTKTNDIKFLPSPHLLYVRRIAATNYYGARHALETLFQLVVWDEVEGNFIILDRADISDWPEFPHRGISVDTARNFIPVENIKTVRVRPELVQPAVSTGRIFR